MKRHPPSHQKGICSPTGPVIESADCGCVRYSAQGIKVISDGVSGFCILSTQQQRGDLWGCAAHSSNTAKLKFPLKPGVPKDNYPS